ncbi:MAG TPA: polymer-forming cytoskeletal protein [Symbiobacteriaceae bacterium]|nr:polymer-forming cytoskeletal protein [Symbiobacteriaceae bacterium]
MRKLLVGLTAILVLVFAVVPSALALERREGNHVTVAKDETVHDDLLLAGTTAVIEGTVEGDVLSFAQNVVVRGTVKGNLVSAGNSVEIQGNVQGTVYTAANVVTVSGRVERSLLAAGSQVTVDKDGLVGHTLMAGGDRLRLSGTVGRGMYVAGNYITVEGKVGQELEAAVNDLVIRNTAVIEGPVTYHSDHTATIDPGARTGEVKYNHYEYRQTDWDQFTWWASMWWIPLKFIGFLLVGLAVLALFPSLRRSFPAVLTANPWQAPLAGFLTLIALPIAAVLLIATIIGIPVSFMLMLAFPALVYFSQILVSWAVGKLLGDHISGMGNWSWPLTFLVGSLLTTLVVNVPAVGWMFATAAVLYGIGGVGYLTFSKRTVA